MYTHIVKKSKFIAISYDTNTKEEIAYHLNSLRKEHKKASHICYAYIIKNGSSAAYSDDGEPSGTAGKPIFNLMTLKGINNKVIFVIRYYGGKKLGASGLIRAYVSAAKNVL